MPLHIYKTSTTKHHMNEEEQLQQRQTLFNQQPQYSRNKSKQMINKVIENEI